MDGIRPSISALSFIPQRVRFAGASIQVYSAFAKSRLTSKSIFACMGSHTFLLYSLSMKIHPNMVYLVLKFEKRRDDIGIQPNHVILQR